MSCLQSWRWRFAVVASVTLLVLMEGSSGTAVAQTERFFHARLRLVQSGSPLPAPGRCTPPEVLVSLDGAGFAGRLGPVSVAASHCIEDDPASIPFTGGILVMSGRRGELHLTYEGTDTGGFLFGTFVVTGGTREYDGATGNGILFGITSPEEERGVVTLAGRLSIPRP